ncbi:nucleotidyltransferase family protein [Pseudomonas sp. UL073]|uniref:Nucleotidyltransferase family protein n=1 Tax=Zestomonas insulae TaxID=2809017 RepID=A0ABS2IH38_9GAMM|nr:nucleotidyltransferase family protein [Pseudomonas insulae]MBM7061478.1 nucleotidyltransferase family protein [Pseudomonas insulae]
MPEVIALLLAAGSASRFGSDKRRARLTDGCTLLAASLTSARRVFAEVYVLLRPEDDALALGLPADCPLLRCPDAALGLGHSLAAGVQALAAQPAEAIAVLLGDMPWLAEASLRQLCAAAHPERIVFPLYQGQRGHPVLFGRAFWPALQQLRGDQGARALLQAHSEACHGVALDDPGVLRDVDTPADLA